MSVQPGSDHFLIEVDGRAAQAEAGQTVAAALLAAGIATFGRTPSGKPRGIFCGMGVCFDCRVAINGLPDQRACLTPVTPGMKVTTGELDRGLAEVSHGRA